MHKWITHGMSILIGLSLLLSGCIFIPIPWETVDFEWQLVRQGYANNSGSDVTLVFTYFKVEDEKETPDGVSSYIKDTVLYDTLTLISKGFNVHRELVSEISEDVVTICKDMYYLDLLYDSSRAVRLLVENNVIKEWIGPPWIDTDSINSPFNYRSWVFEELEELDSVPLYSDAVGKMTFTITDEDLK